MNQAQKTFLREKGVESFDDLDRVSLDRLHYANLADEPDPAPVKPEPELTEAQRQYLLGRTVDDLDSFEREIFAKMAPAEKATAFRGQPRLSAAKVASLPADRRLELAHYADTLVVDYREGMRGVPPDLRSTRNDIATARAHATAYLED